MTTVTTLAAVLSLSFGSPDPGAFAPTTTLPPAPDTIDAPACQPSGMPLEGRASPYDSASVQLADGVVKVCYGRPSARDRVMIGGEHVPFGEVWRMGANEPTVLHTTVPLSVSGISLEPGSYALYTIPGETQWELFVTRSVDHWGLAITDEVRAMEVGSAFLDAHRTDDHVETLTFEFEDEGSRSASLVMEWERSRIEIPVTVTGS